MDDNQIPEDKKQFLKLFLRAWKLKKDREAEPQQAPLQGEPPDHEEGQRLAQGQDHQQREGAESPRVFSRKEYAQNQFWDDRYKEHKGHFDWYVSWPQLREYLTASEEFLLPKNARILMVGCGNSRLSEQMYEAGYENVLSIDISETIVSRMQAEADKKGMKLVYQVADATAMPYEDQTFDVAIDKGTLDALACGDYVMSRKLLAEMGRVAKQVLIISHSSHAKRVPLMGEQYEGRTVFEVKVTLSGQAELINIMRTNMKGKPLSQIIRDQKALKECLEEYKVYQQLQKLKAPESIQRYQIKTTKQEPLEKQSDEQFQYDPRRQSYCYLYRII